MNKEVELILSKLKIVSEEKEQGMYLCDKEHSKLLLNYITNLQQELQRKDNNWNKLKEYIKASDECWDLQAVLDKIKELEKVE